MHHIDPQADGGSNDEDNAIPLCFDCHAKVGHYNDKQPKGTKFRSSELKKRRDQVYDECTRHLVPALRYRIHQEHRSLPKVGFDLVHLGGAPPVRVKVALNTYIDGLLSNADDEYGLYRGRYPWNLNPTQGVCGQFDVVPDVLRANVHLRVGVNLVIIDIYDRPHALLPVTYGYVQESNTWFLDPVDPLISAGRAHPQGVAGYPT